MRTAAPTLVDVVLEELVGWHQGEHPGLVLLVDAPLVAGKVMLELQPVERLEHELPPARRHK